VLFRAGRRIGQDHARDDAESTPADTMPAPAPADSAPAPADSATAPADSAPAPADSAPAPAGSVPTFTTTLRSWARLLSRPPVWGVLIIALAFAADLTISPANGTSDRASNGVEPVFVGAMRHLVSASRDRQEVAGTPAVGALFTMSGAGLGSHFCTASVVDSPNGDLVITAAHCVAGISSGVAFVPGYDGEAPYGVWTVTGIYVDASWKASSDPDDDVAFLRVSQPGSSMPIEEVTGGEQLETGTPPRQFVEVVGYPDSSNQAIACQNWTSEPMPDQLEFDCAGYTDGTSGGPFLAGVNPLNGEGTLIGVIGGYEQGGSTPQVSYSAMFGANVAALYQVAVAGG
jgi:V8-like Glu-specific endopeptidase